MRRGVRMRHKRHDPVLDGLSHQPGVSMTLFLRDGVSIRGKAGWDGRGDPRWRSDTFDKVLASEIEGQGAPFMRCWSCGASHAAATKTETAGHPRRPGRDDAGGEVRAARDAGLERRGALRGAADQLHGAERRWPRHRDRDGPRSAPPSRRHQAERRRDGGRATEALRPDERGGRSAGRDERRTTEAGEDGRRRGRGGVEAVNIRARREDRAAMRAQLNLCPGDTQMCGFCVSCWHSCRGILGNAGVVVSLAWFVSRSWD